MPKFYIKRTQRKIPTNPSLEFAEKILQEAKDFHATEIESEGGGSTIDVGKYVAWKLSIPHTAIPTTAGTGSEVTKFAVFTQDGRKISFEDDKLIPNKYILDSSKLITLPQRITASSGLDALSQAIESWWSPQATKRSRMYSEKAIKKIMDNLYLSFRNPENELYREQMLIAANFSGEAINITHTSICHAISYPLTIHYGLPHGIACAYTLPKFMKLFRFPKENWRKVAWLIHLLKIRKFREIDKDLVADEALTYSRSQNTPIPITKTIILQNL